MGLLKRAGDAIYTIRFLTLLVTPFTDTEAFRAGIIDDQGNRRKDFNLSTIENRDKYRDVFTPFHRLVFNIKKLIAKAPGGSTSIASYAAALYLIKEQFGISESQIAGGLKRLEIDPHTQSLVESSPWFVLEDKRLTSGSYKLKTSKILSSNLEEIAHRNDYVKVIGWPMPVGSIFGIDIYEAVHSKSNQPIYVTVQDLLP